MRKEGRSAVKDMKEGVLSGLVTVFFKKSGVAGFLMEIVADYRRSTMGSKKTLFSN